MSSSIERVRAALELHEPDRVPTFDLMLEFTTDNQVLGRKASALHRLIPDPRAANALDWLFSRIDSQALVDKENEELAHLGAEAAARVRARPWA